MLSNSVSMSITD